MTRTEETLTPAPARPSATLPPTAAGGGGRRRARRVYRFPHCLSDRPPVFQEFREPLRYPPGSERLDTLTARQYDRRLPGHDELFSASREGVGLYFTHGGPRSTTSSGRS